MFIPATVYDNPALLENDPQYIQRLAAMPEAEKRALLYGDWDSYSGQVFTEWCNDSAHYEDGRYTHVILPFEIPLHWRIWCSMDWGYSRPFSVGWYAVDEERRLYRIREYYGCTGTPNEGLHLEPGAAARKIREIEKTDPNLKGRQIFRVADPAIFGTQTGESTATIMEREGLYWQRGKNGRLAGKMQVHHRLAFDDDGIAGLRVFSTCTNFIRTVPALCYSTSDVEDVDTNLEDHIYDELRYVLMENPIAAKAEMKKLPTWNPLEE